MSFKSLLAATVFASVVASPIAAQAPAAAAPAKFCSEEKGASLVECLAPNRRVSIDILGVAK